MLSNHLLQIFNLSIKFILPIDISNSYNSSKDNIPSVFLSKSLKLSLYLDSLSSGKNLLKLSFEYNVDFNSDMTSFGFGFGKP